MKQTIKKAVFFFFFIFLSAPFFAQDYAVFKEGLIRDITPKGWLLELLNRQRDGITGHPEALSYPYNTCLWAGDIPRNTESYGQDWWRYEQTAYYTDGLLRLGYLLDDQELIAKGEEGIEYTLSHAQSNGRLGNSVINSLWPMAVFFRAMKANYEYGKQSGIPLALRRNYLSLTNADLVNGRRHILNLEGMLWTYGITKTRTLLRNSETAYKTGGFEMDMEQAGNNEHIHMHGVTYTEMLKVPMLLYAYTGNEEYLKVALNCERKLERDHLLPDGVPTSAEYTLGQDIDVAHETCDVTDYTWSLGYFLTTTGCAEWADRIEKAVFNAGMGSITKDFRALQYFSSVNQLVCTGNSDFNVFKKGSTWMAYRPTHETECCAGNVNRLFPNFASRLWLRGKDEQIVAAMYAPSEIDFVIDSVSCRIVEDTYYPFDGEVNFRFQLPAEVEIPFVFRVPGWCSQMRVMLNGEEVTGTWRAGTFATISRIFSDGDVVTLKMPMSPVVIDAAEEQGRYVECGPLLFSYPVPTLKKEDTTVYANMNGKVSENPDFKCWSMTPNGTYNYAMDTEARELQLEVDKEKLQNGFPFDLEQTPLKVKLPVRQHKWSLHKDRYNPTTPPSASLALYSQTETISLVPYGCTELRLTVFPVPQNIAGYTLTDSLLVNPDFEQLNATEYNYCGEERKTFIPYGWKVRGTINGQSYGINRDASNLHGENVCWFRLLPFSPNFQLYQTIPASKLQPGTYRVNCLLWCESGAMGTCRLFANDNVQYFGSEDEYVQNQTIGETATFAGYKGTGGSSPFRLERMEVLVTLQKGESLTVGIRTSNKKGDGTSVSGNNAMGWFKVDHFQIERVHEGTAIDRVETDKPVLDYIYDFRGVRLSKEPQKGLYIRNGQKIRR